MKSNFCLTLKCMLKEHKMTHRDLASATGLTESAVSRYINGNRIPNVKNLLKISKALGVTPDTLLKEDIK